MQSSAGTEKELENLKENIPSLKETVDAPYEVEIASIPFQSVEDRPGVPWSVCSTT